MTRTPALATLFVCALAAGTVAACGSSSKPVATAGSGSSTTAGPSSPATSANGAGACPPASALAPPAGLASSSTDLTKKPVVNISSATPPASLVVQDLVVGSGAEATCGQNVSVQYVGVAYSTKKQFDASWDRGQPFSFALGTGSVIPGWDKGVVGMKVGGRRELIIPPDLGYGAQGTPDGSIGPNETLVFIVDLVKVGS